LASTQSEKDYAIAPLAKIPRDFHSPGQAFVQCSMKSKILTTAIFLVPLSLQPQVVAFNPEHLEQLRRTGSCLECDLSSADLPDALLSNTDLRGANLTGANLIRADLRGANLSSANLSGASLINANLAGANLTNSNLTVTALIKANLTAANLAGAGLSLAKLLDANLTGAGLAEC
jgi:uncharacterized protein YjbI with pentapeptide repeats